MKLNIDAWLMSIPDRITRLKSDPASGPKMPSAVAYCSSPTVFPQVISGLRSPIAIQAAISFNMNLPE